MDFEWRIKLTEPKTGQRIKNLIRDRRTKWRRLYQNNISEACDLAPSNLSRFLSCKEGISGESFIRLYEELREYYQSQGLEKEIKFLKDYIPPKVLNTQPKPSSSAADLCFSYYICY